MQRNIDSAGNEFIEIEMPGINQVVRVSLIQEGWNEEECLRINIKDENNHIRQGAEFPIEITDEIIEACKILKARVDE